MADPPRLATPEARQAPFRRSHTESTSSLHIDFKRPALRIDWRSGHRGPSPDIWHRVLRLSSSICFHFWVIASARKWRQEISSTSDKTLVFLSTAGRDVEGDTAARPEQKRGEGLLPLPPGGKGTRPSFCNLSFSAVQYQSSRAPRWLA